MPNPASLPPLLLNESEARRRLAVFHARHCSTIAGRGCRTSNSPTGSCLNRPRFGSGSRSTASMNWWGLHDDDGIIAIRQVVKRDARAAVSAMPTHKSLPNRARWPGRHLLAQRFIRSLERREALRQRQRQGSSTKPTTNTAEANIHQRGKGDRGRGERPEAGGAKLLATWRYPGDMMSRCTVQPAGRLQTISARPFRRKRLGDRRSAWPAGFVSFRRASRRWPDSSFGRRALRGPGRRAWHCRRHFGARIGRAGKFRLDAAGRAQHLDLAGQRRAGEKYAADMAQDSERAWLSRENRSSAGPAGRRRHCGV